MSKIRMPDDFYEQTPDGNVLATEAAMNTIRTADMLFDSIGRLLRPLGVSAAGGLVLGILRDHGRMPPSELGQRLIVTRATVTGLLDSLERRGFVRRSANPADRRSVLVEITPEGLSVLGQLRTLIHRHERDWMTAALSDDELRTFVGLLHRIQDSVEASQPGTSVNGVGEQGRRPARGPDAQGGASGPRATTRRHVR
ncbi:MAG TPA: MarR family transcriptional regulator [Candidatus Dormibacteraeota bacterium]|nr:MarR family transcriptional regulator [Candidatus Dormibacteraeota bacterium]